MENKINGVFILKREFGNNVSILNTKTKFLEYMDYFKFKPILEETYGIEKTKIILDNINSYYRVILDFDKKIAKLIKDKDVDFSEVIFSYLDVKTVQNEYDNQFDCEEIQGRFQTL